MIFKIGKYEAELWIRPEYLNENMVWILIEIPKELKYRDEVLRIIETIENYSPKDGTFEWKWIGVNINPYNISEMENKIIEKLQEIKKVLP